MSKTRMPKTEYDEGRVWEVKLRLTDLEYAYIRMAATLYDIKAMAYVRDTAVEHARKLYLSNRKDGTMAVRLNLDNAMERHNAAVKSKKSKVSKRLPPEFHVGDHFSYDPSKE